MKQRSLLIWNFIKIGLKFFPILILSFIWVIILIIILFLETTFLQIIYFIIWFITGEYEMGYLIKYWSAMFNLIDKLADKIEI